MRLHGSGLSQSLDEALDGNHCFVNVREQANQGEHRDRTQLLSQRLQSCIGELGTALGEQLRNFAPYGR